MMYILTEEEYHNLRAAKGQAGANSASLQDFIQHFAFYRCTECGRLVAMEKSRKDTPEDLLSLAQGCPGCGENVTPVRGTAEELVTLLNR